MRWSWSTSSVPAALAAMAKMPNGVSRTMKRATRAMAVLAVRSTSSSGCLCSHADEGQPGHHREQHHRRDDVVGQRVERVGRDVEIEEVEGVAIGRRGTVEARGVDVGQGQREEEREPERRRPDRRQHRAGADGEGPRLAVGQRAEVDDDRQRHVRQHGHLQQPDETAGEWSQRRHRLAEEEPDEDAEPEPGEHLVRESHAGRAQVYRAARRRRVQGVEPAAIGVSPIRRRTLSLNV